MFYLLLFYYERPGLEAFAAVWLQYLCGIPTLSVCSAGVISPFICFVFIQSVAFCLFIISPRIACPSSVHKAKHRALFGLIALQLTWHFISQLRELASKPSLFFLFFPALNTSLNLWWAAVFHAPGFPALSSFNRQHCGDKTVAVRMLFRPARGLLDAALRPHWCMFPNRAGSIMRLNRHISSRVVVLTASREITKDKQMLKLDLIPSMQCKGHAY